MILIIFVVSVLTYLFIYIRQKFALTKYDKLIPGPPTLPLLGNGLDFMNAAPVEIYNKIEGYAKTYGERFRLLLGPDYYILVSNPEDIEAIFTSPKVLEKSGDYYFFTEWLGRGLLLSHGEKWFQRRKLLTHAFHFKILDDFIRVFDSQAITFIKQMKKFANRPAIDVSQHITLYTLDVINEAAMGIKLDAQINSDTEYVKNIMEASSIMYWRVFNTLAREDWYWRLTSKAKRYAYLVERIHKFTNGVIDKRRIELENEARSHEELTGDNDLGIKKRYALLDLLLRSVVDGKPLSNEDIDEEVNNFMFAGHDTTTATLNFLFYSLARYPHIQQKVFEEIKSVLGENRDEPVTLKKLNELKYLDLVIKEVLRLHSPVPFITRSVSEDLELNGKFYPAGSRISILIQIMHKNPKYFKDPEEFIPERHDVVKSSDGLSNFAYVPFAGGYRNCLGQKFALYEIKTVTTKFLSHYRLELKENFVPVPSPEIVLKPATGMWLKLIDREY